MSGDNNKNTDKNTKAYQTVHILPRVIIIATTITISHCDKVISLFSRNKTTQRQQNGGKNKEA